MPADPADAKKMFPTCTILHFEMLFGSPTLFHTGVSIVLLSVPITISSLFLTATMEVANAVDEIRDKIIHILIILICFSNVL
jgi:hypothetical protein